MNQAIIAFYKLQSEISEETTSLGQKPKGQESASRSFVRNPVITRLHRAFLSSICSSPHDKYVTMTAPRPLANGSQSFMLPQPIIEGDQVV